MCFVPLNKLFISNPDFSSSAAVLSVTFIVPEFVALPFPLIIIATLSVSFPFLSSRANSIVPSFVTIAPLLATIPAPFIVSSPKVIVPLLVNELPSPTSFTPTAFFPFTIICPAVSFKM